MASADILNVIHFHIPSVDQHISKYIVGVLTSSTFYTIDEVKAAIGELLESCLNDAFEVKKNSSDQFEDVCEKLFNIISANNEIDNNDLDNDETNKLSKPISLGSTQENYNSEWKSIWTSLKEVESKVDRNKLRKAEEKLKQKAAKRDGTDLSAITISNVEASASQSLSKKDTKLEDIGANRVKDIKIENFDISFGSNLLLKSANLNLSKFYYLKI